MPSSLHVYTMLGVWELDGSNVNAVCLELSQLMFAVWSTSTRGAVACASLQQLTELTVGR
ncbi:hypothetical protein AALO_G00030300 [Alosa alosa]|uniref:Uncharacterized protein n=1 Tax=Alosa alosa TaxID=278164 RepID=A0AAV6HC39_9TELE|nr:hypothetical protein AALO_G00030300 [Alosa alosa]